MGGLTVDGMQHKFGSYSVAGAQASCFSDGAQCLRKMLHSEGDALMVIKKMSRVYWRPAAAAAAAARSFVYLLTM